MSISKLLIDSFINEGVPETPLLQAIEFFTRNSHKIINKSFMTIVDYSKHSNEKRMYILDLKTGEVQKEYTSHGSGKKKNPNYDPHYEDSPEFLYPGDPDQDGFLNSCLHEDGSRTNMTRPGFMLVQEAYESKIWAYGEMKGKMNGLRIDGLERRNEDVRKAAVVIHEADYNFSDEEYAKNPSLKNKPQETSFGCPSVPRGSIKYIIPKLEGGSLLYLYVPQCE